jgi:FtsZ-binding cell division protein ZapB
MPIATRPALLILGAALASFLPRTAHSQLGNLIKKQVEKKAPQDPGAQGPPVFDAVTLEITPERIDKLLEAKRAARRIADGPTGPNALREKAGALDERQAMLYTKYGKEIEVWDEKRRTVENCRDSSLSAIKDSKRPTQAQDMMKYQQLALAMAMAQQKGDTAEVRRLTEQFQKGQEPSAADSAAVLRRCGDPSPPAVVKEWMALKGQVEALQNQAQNAEAEVERTETQASGMNTRQRAVFCERIKALVARLKAKQATAGFSDAEVEAARKRDIAIKDLEALCP